MQPHFPVKPNHSLSRATPAPTLGRAQGCTQGNGSKVLPAGRPTSRPVLTESEPLVQLMLVPPTPSINLLSSGFRALDSEARRVLPAEAASHLPLP